MAGHPLRPATRLSLGGPLPRQLADGTRTHPMVQGLRRSPLLFPHDFRHVVLSGISQSFPWLSQALGQIIHVLLTRAPLYSSEDFRARLACVRHAASVRSEPGSNSPVKLKKSFTLTYKT